MAFLSLAFALLSGVNGSLDYFSFEATKANTGFSAAAAITGLALDTTNVGTHQTSYKTAAVYTFSVAHAPFKPDTWDQHTHELFVELDGEQARGLVSYFTHAPDLKDYKSVNNHYKSDRDLNRTKGFAELITEKDLMVLKDDACEMFGTMLKYMKIEVVKSMRPNCLGKMFSAALFESGDYSLNEKWVNEVFPDEMRKRFGTVLLERVVAKKMVGKLSEKAIENILEDSPRRCAHLDVDALTALAAGKAQLVSQDCMAMVPKAVRNGVTDASKFKNFKEDVFQKTTRVSAAITKHMTASQLEKFSTYYPKRGGQCLELELAGLNPEVLPKVPLFCFVGRFSKGPVNLGKNVVKIPADHFGKLPTSTLKKVYSNIPEADKKLLTIDQVNAILANPNNCGAVNILADSVKKGVKVSGQCFAKLPLNIQAKIITDAASLPDDLLSYLKSDFDKLSISDKNRVAFKGVGVVALMEKRANVEKIVQGIGSAVAGYRPCAIINTDALLKNNMLMLHATEECASDMQLKLDAKHLKSLKGGILGRFHPDVVDGLITWKEVSPIVMKMVVEGHRYCAVMNLERFREIPAEARKTIDSQCLVDFTERSGLSGEELKALGTEVTSRLSAELVKDMRMSDFTDAQFGHMGDDLPATATHPGTLLTEAILSQITVERLGAIGSKLLAKVPAASFKAFNTKERVQSVTPAAIISVDVEQGKNMAVEFFTKEQVMSFGSNHRGTPNNPVSVFTEAVLAKMVEPGAKEAAMDRLKELSGNSAPSMVFDIVMILTALTIALALPALA